MSRDGVTKRVMKAIALTSLAVSLPVTAADGSSPIVVALPYELVSDVVSRVVSVGGQANVAIAFAESFHLVVIDNQGRTPGDNPMEINQDISMGMLLNKLQQHPRKRVNFRFKNIDAGAPSGQQELAYA